MTKLISALFLIFPALCSAGLITHKFDINLYDQSFGQLLNTATITMDADPDTWTINQAWLEIDGKTLASNETSQLGKDGWTYTPGTISWDPDPFMFTFSDGDWEFTWLDGWTEVTSLFDENPIYKFPARETFYNWEWMIYSAGQYTNGGRMAISNYDGWTYKVPEPSSIALLGLGLAALAFRRRSA